MLDVGRIRTSLAEVLPKRPQSERTSKAISTTLNAPTAIKAKSKRRVKLIMVFPPIHAYR